VLTVDAIVPFDDPPELWLKPPVPLLALELPLEPPAPLLAAPDLPPASLCAAPFDEPEEHAPAHSAAAAIAERAGKRTLVCMEKSFAIGTCAVSYPRSASA
jgi:hypothetical protein